MECGTTTLLLIALIGSIYTLEHEALKYSKSILANQQNSYPTVNLRRRRSAQFPAFQSKENKIADPIHLSFFALNRAFDLRLWESWKDVFSTDFFVELPHGGRKTLSDIIKSNSNGSISSAGNGMKSSLMVVKGHLMGKENDSVVYGYAKDGVFHGRIKDHREGKSFYVENIDRIGQILNEADVSKLKEEASAVADEGEIHSVIYDEMMVKSPHKLNSGDDSDEDVIATACAYNGATKDYMDQIQTHMTYHHHQTLTSESVRHTIQERVRRSDGGGGTDSDSSTANSIYPKNTCLLSITSDHLFSAQFQDASVVTAEISNFVHELNNIFEKIEFSDGTTGYGFAIGKITIEDESSLQRNGYKYKDPYIGVEKLLDLMSTEDHSDYCLAYLFTARDFMNGVLGLAWVAGDTTSGGICERYKLHQNGQEKSLNTGVITTVNYGQPVAARVSHLTFTHEVGHNWGSPHDFPADCKPGGSEGNYIMFASATSADKPNNNKFSHCSLSNMSHVLIKRRDQCFTEAGRAICGNMVLDEGEECDCGFETNCLSKGDQCCWPADSPNGCQLKPGFKCSPSQGPCCTSECQLVPQSASYQCQEASECIEASFCDGNNVKCEPQKKPDLTYCNKESQVCMDGVCSGSLCLKHDMVDCLCNDNEQYYCDLCCQSKDKPETCQTSALLPQFNYFRRMKHIGTPCNDLTGYCDAFNRCMAIDSNGPLSRLKDAIFNPDVYKDIFQWSKDHWWLTVLLCVSSTMVFILFVKVFSVHTPSSNPKLPKNRDLRDTMSTLPRTLRRHRSEPSAAARASHYQRGNRRLPPTSNMAVHNNDHLMYVNEIEQDRIAARVSTPVSLPHSLAEDQLSQNRSRAHNRRKHKNSGGRSRSNRSSDASSSHYYTTTTGGGNISVVDSSSRSMYGQYPPPHYQTPNGAASSSSSNNHFQPPSVLIPPMDPPPYTPI